MMLTAALLLATTAPCAPQDGAPQAAPTAPNATTAPCKDVSTPNWRAVATQQDRERLRGWRDTWRAALEAARGGGSARDATGALFDPDRALPDPLPPAGAYTCRIYKLGAQPPATRTFNAYPPQECQVNSDGDLLRLIILGGPQRPIGHIYSDTNARGVFLGTLVLGDEASPLNYGQDDQRDMAGFVDHVADGRWRIALPQPAFESMMDVIELQAR